MISGQNFQCLTPTVLSYDLVPNGIKKPQKTYKNVSPIQRTSLILSDLNKSCFVLLFFEENLSKGKKATQLGTWEGYGPERAVDGNTDPEISKGSCAHPHSYDLLVEADERGGRTWWSVDLSSNDPNKRFVLKYVVIYNRKSVSGKLTFFIIKRNRTMLAYIVVEKRLELKNR